jgi:predicted ribosome quality control (RQC) complex YloA/Tae2 family protein
MDDMAVKIQSVDDRAKSNTRRIDVLEKRADNLDNLVSSVAILATKQETIERDVSETKQDVKGLAISIKSIAEKPAKRWDNLMEKLVWFMISAGIGALLLWAGIQL